MMWDFNHWGGFGMGFGWIVPLAVLGLLVWAAFSLSRLSRSRDGHKGENQALDVLKERYARGDLTREEFEHMKRDIA